MSEKKVLRIDYLIEKGFGNGLNEPFAIEDEIIDWADAQGYIAAGTIIEMDESEASEMLAREMCADSMAEFVSKVAAILNDSSLSKNSFWLKMVNLKDEANDLMERLGDADYGDLF